LGWLYLAVAIVTEVIGTSALAPSQGFTKPVPTIIVLISYAAAFYLLSQTLHTIPVAVAYAVWSGAGVALITLIALGDVRPAPRCLRASWHRTYRRRRAGDPIFSDASAH
jgi:multidrug transporter EmrE-like cation transporter